MISGTDLEAHNSSKDPETGFLLVRDHLPVYNLNGISSTISFSPSKKFEFLTKLAETWPDDGEALRHVSICWKTYDYHKQMDPVFADCVEQINRNGVSTIKKVMFKFASEKVAGFMDRIALGRIYARDEFDPKARIEVTHKKDDREDMRKRWDRLGSVVDAELVRAVTRTLSPGSGAVAPGSGSNGPASTDPGKPAQ